MAKSEYRSSIRSKTAIKLALAKLLQQKDYSKITVTDIINESGISRGTFYAHFKSIDEVLHRIDSDEYHSIVQMVNNHWKELTAEETAKGVFIEISRHVNSNADYYRSLVLSPELSSRIAERLSDDYFEPATEFAKGFFGVDSNDEAKIFLRFVFGGFNCVLYQWANQGTDLTDEQMASLLTKILFSMKL